MREWGRIHEADTLGGHSLKCKINLIWIAKEKRLWEYGLDSYSSGHDQDVEYLNFSKPTGHVMHQQFNIQELYVLPTLYLCVLYLSWNKTTTCATYIINWLGFITEMKSVYCAVRTGSLNKAVCASYLKQLREFPNSRAIIIISVTRPHRNMRRWIVGSTNYRYHSVTQIIGTRCLLIEN